MKYPLDLTDEEKELGFQIMKLENPSNSVSDFSFRPVVACILSESVDQEYEPIH
jgi:hypothetical protein